MKYLHGQFLSNNNTLYEVRIKNNSAVSGEMIIGGDSVKFSSDPVHITTNCESLFTHIIKKSATITLYSKVMLTDYIFAANQNDVEVEIYEGNNLIFKGYVEPNIYSMPYAHEWDEISINCLDYLSIMQYSKPTDNSTYEIVKANASIKPLYQIITSLIPNRQIVFDGSRTVANNSGYNIFHCISVSELVFLGENEDDVMTNEEILFEILQYLNLHIIQEGNTFYIFDFNSRHKNSIRWVDMVDNTLFKNQTVNTITLTKDDYSSDGTNITVDDVFNQIQVKSVIEKMETVVESPLDKNKLYSQFGNYQKFMTEYISELQGKDASSVERAAKDFKALIEERTDFYVPKNCWLRNYFFQIKENPNWTFYHNGNDIYNELYESDSSNNKVKQWKFLKYLRENRFASCIMSLAKGDKIHPQDIDDNELQFSDYLVISVNGEGKGESTALSEFSTDIQAQTPIIEYVGNSNGVYSPNDIGTTNYLVFSGKLTLIPIVLQSGLIDGENVNSQNNKYSDTIQMLNLGTEDLPTRQFMDNGDTIYGNSEFGSYYLNKYWTQEKSIKDVPYVASPYYNYYQPNTDVNNIIDETIKYNLSKIDGQNYSIDKVPVLECQLKIGNKYCVETFEQGEGGDYKESSFGWYTLNECPYENGVRKTTFSLGIKPKIGDNIIGKEHKLQTNFDYTWNISASDGTAIPITREDNLQGEVEFRIMGLVNTTWNNQLTRKTTFWDYIFQTENDKSILNHISSVIIKDFECKIYSDNNGYANDSDNDLIYLSDEQHQYIKVKDDIEMKINTALSSEEAYQYKVENTVNLSSAIDTNTGYALPSLTDAVENETAKGEELYCNWFYKEYSTPKIILETDLKNSVNIDIFNKYNIGYMNKNFGIVETSKDLKENQTHIKFREI